MSDIEEASAAKVTANSSVTFPEYPPGFWERLEELRQARKRWLLTVPGRWWQAKEDEREEAMNDLFKQLADLGVSFDEEYIGIPSHELGADQIAQCLECDAESIEQCKACELWPVVDG